MSRPRSCRHVALGLDAERTSAGGCHACACERIRPDKVRARQDKREALRAHKLAAGCARCGYAEHHAALHLHHRDPAEKEFKPSRAIRAGWDRMWAEVAKCDVLCANCHAVLHALG